MIEVYITDIRQWNEEAVYHEWLNRLPAERRERAESCRHAADQRRSLAGTLLVYYAFAQWQDVRQRAVMLHAVSKNDAYEHNSVKRVILQSGALEMEMPDVNFAYGNDGKPYFSNYPQFHFSISHSGDYAVCAVSEKEVGVDIQEIRPVKTDIAKRFFTEDEKAWIAQDARHFFRIWSAKESYVKLTGRGMAEGLTTFTADMEAGRIRQEQTAYLKEYEAPEHYVLTVCGYEQEFGGRHIYEI